VNEFSEYARAPAPMLAEVDLNQLIGDVLALYEPMGIAIHVKLEDKLPLVVGDAMMLRQVLHNLLQNSQDALGGKPHPEIEICSMAIDDKVKLKISDNGEGFPAEIISRVFEPYMTTKRHGTGLGLAIVRKIIEEHKGSIQIQNLKDSSDLDDAAQTGASITIILPSVTKKTGRNL
jgi:nitrogen fixation/metabolism regulation signal transduction histidine kinase